jgi:uncharacterized RDD family membrane protein YckC
VTPAESAVTEPAAPAPETPVPARKNPPRPLRLTTRPSCRRKRRRTANSANWARRRSSSTTPAKKKSTRRNRGSRGAEEAPHFGDQTIAATRTQDAAVTIFGNTTVDGHLTDAAVSVFGNTTVNGTVDGEAVSVFGTTTINGKVKGEVVTVYGDLVLGPEADVGGEAVVVFGKIIKAPGAQIHGNTQEVVSFRPLGDAEGLSTWFTKCLLMGRPLAFDSRLMWAWYVAFGLLAFYALIALITPAGVQKCMETLDTRPGSSLLAALLTMLLTPIAYLLLVLTLTIAIGFVLLPLFSLGLFFAAIFGKIVMLAWLGRRCTKLLGDGPLAHPVFGVLIGGVIMLLLYTVPIGGFRPLQADGHPRPGRGDLHDDPGVQGQPSAEAGGRGGRCGHRGSVGRRRSASVAAAVLPPVISSATLPRAGFWIRLAAVVLDAILIGMVCGFLSNMWSGFGVFPFWFAAYCAAMWATKGTTIGGIICSLKVVRLDDRPLDWGVAVVRTLGGFLSLFVAGLGFIWVAFDDEKQSGTTRSPARPSCGCRRARRCCEASGDKL